MVHKAVNAVCYRQTVLEHEMELSVERLEIGERMFRAMGDAAPAFGLVGTLVGLVQMLSNLDEPSSLGPAMTVALLTTLCFQTPANSTDRRTIGSKLFWSAARAMNNADCTILGRLS